LHCRNETGSLAAIAKHPRYQASLDRTYAAIIAAAAEVLAERGEDERTSMARIAEEAGVGRATLYRHFDNRSALLGELARVGVAESGERLRDVRLDDRPFPEVVRRIVDVFCDVGDRYVAIFRNNVPFDAVQVEREVRGPLDELIRQAQLAGSVRDDLPPRVLRECLTSMVIYWLRSDTFEDRDERVDAITSLFLGAASPAAASTSVPSGAGAAA
jgi:AcrR family transcriptional regulator